MLKASRLIKLKGNVSSLQKCFPLAHISSKDQFETFSSMKGVEGKVCKRKVVFDVPEEDSMELKRGTTSISSPKILLSVDPVNQARRKQ
ncbi:hypothetical protein Ddye_004919 [Dipteronia dyeriana]|uniref:Uncharacterized protein n=1 Tax=Dipteronia dyeriana TaxID=168575 RepID=A0AAD9XFS0_9ROSI|nr:hypothetical protein Ddye_004919 [Dipteronia dyeriana]